MRELKLVAAALSLVVAATLLTPFGRDLSVGDETKYGQVVREMRSSGSWFVPTLNGAPFSHKPPLHFWMIGVLTYIFGIYSTWSFVLPSLAAFAFLLFIVWRMGGVVAAFVCGTSLMVWVSAQTARMDVSFTAFITLAIWMLQRFFDDHDQHALHWSGVWLGVATLIKGPMAPVIAVVLFAFECWRRKTLPRANYAYAAIAMIVIPLAWLGPAVMLGGGGFAQELIVKQTVGRAIASWVHRAPPWYYLLHLPGILLPWFFLALLGLRNANRFYLTWIAAVLVPYSLLSSKLDVYMMALIPPVALLVAGVATTSVARTVNIAMLAIFAAAGVVARMIAKPELMLPGVQRFLWLFTALAVVALVVSLFVRPLVSTIALGLMPVLALAYAAVTMMPLFNELATTRPLIAALSQQHVDPGAIALYTCPYLWSRDFPSPLERVHYVDADNVGSPMVIATSRAHAGEIAAALRGYKRVDQLQMIGKWFDVYRK